MDRLDVIDWHTHILPNVDDGSRDVSESAELLRMLFAQNVRTVIVTPHFYADIESAQEFLKRRARSYDKLMEAISSESEMPRILLGAEVKYYPGISVSDALFDLCIQGTRLLLLEMPFSEWTEYTLRELEALAGAKGITVVLAHIDRYFSLQRQDIWRRLRDDGIRMQMNADFLSDFRTRRKALDLLDRGFAHMIGSDCHNVASRPPSIDRAYGVIRRKRGEDLVRQMQEYGHFLLERNTCFQKGF